MLCEMICDWSVAILEEAINDPTRCYDVRQYAITKLGELLIEAVERGYSRITRQECFQLVSEAKARLKAGKDDPCFEDQAVEDLCGHLSQAIADNFFGELPDF
jgi:hypothetical protein